tara:strand:+ start:197 stop:706 length:510 start_codon:yes stop_codon:yes gene_type:complete
MELPLKMDESMMRQTMELSTIIGTYLTQLCSKADEIVAALSRDSESVKIAGQPIGVRMEGMSALLASKGSEKYLGNIGTAASGQLGDALRSELKNKPSGSDLVIANSSETIIPASGFPASNGGSGGPSGVTIGSINISGVDDPRAIANQVAEEIMHAMQRATYSEINIS